MTLSDANLPCTEAQGHETSRHQELAKLHHLLQNRLLRHLVVKKTDSPIPHSKASACLKINTRSRETSAHFFPICPHELHQNFFESKKEPHQILLRQSKLSSSTCCCIYLMHKPQKRPRELSIENESHLYPSPLESLTFGKILSRTKRAQEVLYPLYPRRITSA